MSKKESRKKKGVINETLTNEMSEFLLKKYHLDMDPSPKYTRSKTYTSYDVN